MDEIPCTAQSKTVCEGCTLTHRLMCRYEARDTTHFFMIILPFFVTAIAGVISVGYGWWLMGWLVYSPLFLGIAAGLFGLSYFYTVVHPWLPGQDGLYKSIPLTAIALAGLFTFSAFLPPCLSPACSIGRLG